MINHPVGRPAQPGPDAAAPPPAAAPRPTAPRTAGPGGAVRVGGAVPLALAPRPARVLVLLAAFVCAACGLVYELELVALGGYLLGDSVTQTSVVLSVMVFAMGVGSLLAKGLTRRPATSFALVEYALSLVGGLSALALYCGWAWLHQPRATLVALIAATVLIGLLIGAEIPLLMTLIQRIRREHAGRAVADLFAADYVGALVGGLAFPFVLLPALGQTAGALLTGAVNAVAGAVVVLWLFRAEPAPRARLLLWTGCGLVLALLALAAACTGAIERAARHALYGGPIRFAAQSRYQEIVLTGGPGDAAPGRSEDASRVPRQRTAPPLELFLDGRLAVCGPGEYRDHEALVRPALAAGPSGRVLVLGGGDGLALREVLRHPAVRSVLVVERDPALPALARRDAALAALTGHSFDDPRVRLVRAEPMGWLRGSGERFDVIVSDLDGAAAGGKYRSREFFGLAARRLVPAGRLAVRAGSPEDGLWTAEAGLDAAGLAAVAYQGGAPAAADCGRPGPAPAFLLAARTVPALGLAPDAPAPRSLTVAALQTSRARLAAARPSPLPPPHSLLGP
ncbi:polyamine aminopropyltransferase 2 [Kitasatospora phosalacinea]|uniref:Polyamine aminopropyltransferase 2 n=1 Tax=Kitasatospora phosalacinea TaxID=2065 RepID=A0A9W6Q575_9ACTN|nr:spermidine synthase [Kitasatospora phosalacinea]GLW68743.1 polyamine aminopropyltransferase 2 [Kitasatospora phosalacinea]